MPDGVVGCGVVDRGANASAATRTCTGRGTTGPKREAGPRSACSRSRYSGTTRPIDRSLIVGGRLDVQTDLLETRGSIAPISSTNASRLRRAKRRKRQRDRTRVARS